MRATRIALAAFAALWFVVALGTLVWPEFGQVVPTVVYWPLTIALFATACIEFVVAARATLRVPEAKIFVVGVRLTVVGFGTIVLGHQIFVTFLSPMYMGGVGYSAMALVGLHQCSLAASALALGVALRRWAMRPTLLVASVLGWTVALVAAWMAFYGAYNLLRGANVGVPY